MGVATENTSNEQLQLRREWNQMLQLGENNRPGVPGSAAAEYNEGDETPNFRCGRRSRYFPAGEASS
jgi:hypothetical protein